MQGTVVGIGSASMKKKKKKEAKAKISAIVELIVHQESRQLVWSISTLYCFIG